MAVTLTTTVEARWREGNKRHSRVKLVSSSTGNTYATGIAVPAFGILGLKRNLEFLVLTSPVSADGYVYKYDQANAKILAYQAPAKATTAVAALSQVATSTLFNSKTWYAEAVGG